MKNFIVEAKVITPTHLYFDCPLCWSRYKKNGEPYKTAKRVTHTHGNDTQSKENRITTRSPHCTINRDFNEFTINITDNTIRKRF